MTIVVTPPIGSKGIYSLASPFDRLVDAGVEYSCMAVRKLSDYIASNEKPEDLIYKAYGIEDRYTDDLQKDVYIVSLQSRRGHWLYVPENYILAFPSGSGHRYRSVSLVFSLPPLPSVTDLTTVQEEVIGVVKNMLGVNAKSKVVETSLTTLVSDDKHIEVSTNRELSKTSNGTWQEVFHLREQNRILTEKLAALEAYIVAQQ